MNVRQVIPKDAIPSVDEPAFGSEYFGDPADEVIVLDAEPARAYPVRILDYHEVVNDEVALAGTGGDPVPVVVTWCPLCGSAVVYDRRIQGLNGAAPTFGVSGKLADDDLVMYDRATGSEWKQSLGECIAGELVGESLAVLPSAMLPYERFHEDSPDGVVLQRPGGASEAASDTDEPAAIDYDRGPYDAYFEMDGFGLEAHRGGTDDRDSDDGGDAREWDRDDLDPKTVVLGVEFDDDALGFPLPRVEAAGGIARASVGGHGVAVFATPDGIHAFADPGFAFEPAGAGRFLADGTTWDGATGVAADGRRLDRVPARRLFAFAWHDDHGPVSFYEG